MKSKPKKSKNTGLGVLFIFVILIIFGLAFIVKGISLYQKSIFDGKTNYNILIESQSPQVVSLKPTERVINVVRLGSSDRNFSKLGIPIDAKIQKEIDIENVKSQLPSSLFGSLNPIDALKIIFYVELTQASNIGNVTLNGDDNVQVSETFSDPLIAQEKMTIQLVNATGEQGIGAFAARIVSNTGGNVILVSTQDRSQDNSQIISDKNKSETFKKFKQMFNLEWKKDEKAEISDIKIIIGRDFLKRL